MNRLVENRRLIAIQLGGVDRRARVSFAAACAERLFPAFGRYAGHPRTKTLRTIPEVIWSYAEGSDLPAEGARQLELECDRLAPESEGNSSPFVSAALNAAIAAAAALRCVIHAGGECAGAAAEAVTDTVYQSLSAIDPNDRDHWSKVLAHPVMMRELEWQRSDIQALTAGASARDLRIGAQQRGEELLAALERLLFAG